MMLGSAESEYPMLSHKIIFEVFQPMWSG